MKNDLEYTMTMAQRSAQMWLSVDDVLARLPIGRSTFWSYVKKGKFNTPHYWRGKPLWTQSDIGDFIDGTACRVELKSTMDAVTWDSVKNLLDANALAGLTNKQIAHALNAYVEDVTVLTRLLAKAGEIKMFQPLRKGCGAPNFYCSKNELP